MDARKRSLFDKLLGCTEAALEMDSDSDKDEIILGLARATEMLTEIPGTCKRVWTKKWRMDRKEKGSFKFPSNDLLTQDPSSYQNYLRMDKKQFDNILQMIRADIERSDTQMREAVAPEEKLPLTLRFLATGESFTSLNYQTRLSITFISQAILEVCKALIARLMKDHLKFPSSPLEWEAIARQFAIKWQFPNCVGALDGKHVQFRSARTDGAFYHNYKGTNSIVLLALVDANLRFIFADVGCNGRVNDAGVLQRSQLSS